MQEQINMAKKILEASVHGETKLIRLSTPMAQIMGANATVFGITVDEKQHAAYKGIPLIVEALMPQGLHILSQNWA